MVIFIPGRSFQKTGASYPAGAGNATPAARPGTTRFTQAGTFVKLKLSWNIQAKDMKRFTCLAALFWLIAAMGASAGFKLTENICRVQRLQEVQNEARTRKKPICIIYTDANSTCSLAARAALDAIAALEKRSIILYVNSSNESGYLPADIKKILRSPECGEYIPITIIVDADLKNVIFIIPYSGEVERKARLTKAKMAISAWEKTAEQSSTVIPPTVDTPSTSEMRTWTSASGQTLEGRFSRLQQDVVVLIKPDETTVQIHINKLSGPDQIIARQLSTSQR